MLLCIIYQLLTYTFHNRYSLPGMYSVRADGVSIKIPNGFDLVRLAI